MKSINSLTTELIQQLGLQRQHVQTLSQCNFKLAEALDAQLFEKVQDCAKHCAEAVDVLQQSQHQTETMIRQTNLAQTPSEGLDVLRDKASPSLGRQLQALREKLQHELDQCQQEHLKLGVKMNQLSDVHRDLLYLLTGRQNKPTQQQAYAADGSQDSNPAENQRTLGMV